MKVARTRRRRIVKLKGDDLENCPICLYTLRTRRPVVYLPCGHSLHLRCEKKMRDSLCASCNNCPICRHIIDPSADFLNVEVHMCAVRVKMKDVVHDDHRRIKTWINRHGATECVGRFIDTIMSSFDCSHHKNTN